MDWHVIEARIHYLTPAEGGRQSGVASGYRGQFFYEGNDFDGFQLFPDLRPGEFVNLGEEVRAFVQFRKERWNLVHKHVVTLGMPFQIREGSRVVGNGIVTRLVVPGSEWHHLLG
jgi:translation elongation factor EF-Tu-like GTPase